MVLVDTSVWIDHFRKNDEKLEFLLYESLVVIHPYVISELACGNLKNKKLILSLLDALPKIKSISNEEYRVFLEKNKLYGKGIGLVDIHLLASALISNVNLYSKDVRLSAVASRFQIQFT